MRFPKPEKPRSLTRRDLFATVTVGLAAGITRSDIAESMARAMVAKRPALLGCIHTEVMRFSGEVADPLDSLREASRWVTANWPTA